MDFFSVPKTFHQLYAPDDTGKEFDIKTVGLNIERVKTVKYLGVLIDEDRKFWSQI